MRQLVTEEFSPISETTGTIQNASRQNTVEVSNTTVKGSGVLLPPLKKASFTDQTLYARCFDGAGAEIVVLPLAIGSGGGGGGGSGDIPSSSIASDEQVIKILDDLFGEDGKYKPCGCSAIEFVSDEAVGAMLTGIFGNSGSSSADGIASDKQINDMLDGIFGSH